MRRLSMENITDRTLAAAVNRTIGELRDEPALTASLVAARAMQMFASPSPELQSRLRQIATFRLERMFGLHVGQ